jgi:AraC family transcriptional regulator
LNLTTVAAAVGLGDESWRTRFTAETGVPPATYRMQRRVEAAAELLRGTSLTNREVADALGFSDEHHFARRFRSVVGLTTTAYRRTGGAVQPTVRAAGPTAVDRLRAERGGRPAGT